MTFLSWNPINLLDVEAKWLATEFFVLVGAMLFSKCVGIILRAIDRRVNAPSFHVVVTALYVPFVSLVWFFVALFSFDLVTDGLLRDSHPQAYATIVNGGVVFAVGWFLLRLKNGLIAYLVEVKRNEGKAPDAATFLAISKVLSIAIAFFVLTLLHDATGMSLTTFLAFGGVGGLALAFASQEIFSNFFGGLMIHITRPFVVGESVMLPAHSIDGVIEEIGWYQTRVRSLAKAAVYIPNSLFSKALLVNKSRITHQLIDDTFSFSIYPLSTMSTILQDTNTYIRSLAFVDPSEWNGARIGSMDGPICNMTINAVLTATTLSEYYLRRDEVLLHVGEIVMSHGGVLSSVPHQGF